MRTTRNQPTRGLAGHDFRSRRRAPAVGCLTLSILFAAGSAAAPSGPPPSPGAAPACEDPALTSYAGLLVVAPHPDDETLGFAGLVSAYMRQGKPVEVVVVTDGDAYCDACRFWKNASVHGPTCGTLELSNLATPGADSFAEVRRGESAAAAAVLGRRPPTFLGYPDTGVAAAWLNSRRGEPDRRLRRSDFSRCPDCEACEAGYGGGPETDLTAGTLVARLASLLAATPAGTLLATTHWLDGHPDHAALGNFVKTVNDGLSSPRAVAYAVIHAHNPKGIAHGDCLYPGPPALACPCADETRAAADPTFVRDLRAHRYRPELPAALPDDAAYGPARHLCLPPELYAGDDAIKLKAVRCYRSQLGTLARDRELPPSLDALIDCNGYLLAFVRSTEAFVLTEPGTAPSACDPAGTWEGSGGAAGQGAEVGAAALTLARTGGRALVGAVTLPGRAGGARQEAVVGEVDPRCNLTLRVPQSERLVVRGSVSRDGRSMYGSWGGESAGFLVVHR